MLAKLDNELASIKPGRKKKMKVDDELRRSWIHTHEQLHKQFIYSGLSQRQFIIQHKKTIDAVIRLESAK